MTARKKDAFTHIPEAFQDVLTDLYAGKLQPVNHQADALDTRARNLIRTYGHWGKSPGGLRVYETPQVDDALDGTDVRYSLMTERSRRMDAMFHAYSHNIITLALNGNFHQPAALFVPAQSKETSASVIVGNYVNEIEHMERIGEILGALTIDYESNVHPDSD